MQRHVLAAACLVCMHSSAAHATYSIVAVDTATRAVGGAGTSCIGSNSVRVIYGSVPDTGVVHAQALLGGGGKAAAVMQIADGVDPEAILSAITTLAFDANAQRRQYGIVDLMGRTAGFTGTQTGAYAGDEQGVVATFPFSIQGNILTSAAVLTQARTAFETGGGCDLADRLMLALEAGAANNEGDSRCTPDGIPADSAFIQVDRPGEPAGSYLQLDVTGTAPQSPVVLLRAQYDQWRASHPCPVPHGDGGTIGSDAGSDPAVDSGGCCDSGRSANGSLVLVVLTALGLARRSRSSSSG